MTRDRLVVPPGRQGPGELPTDAVARIDVGLRRRAGGVLPGDHLAAGAQAGTELARLRPYEAGDDVRQLDPSASARTGVPHVRLQVPERAITTWLVLDVSPSMAFGTARRLKSDVTEGVAEVIGRLAVRRGGRVAVVTAGEARPRLLPPRGGREALAALRRLVAEGVVPDGSGVDGERRLGSALQRVERLARTRGLVVIVSDFRDPGSLRRVRALAERHTVLAVEIVDPLETALPDAGVLFFVDPRSGEQVEVDTSSVDVRERFARTEESRRADLLATLRRAQAQHVVLRTDRDWLRDLGKAIR